MPEEQQTNHPCPVCGKMTEKKFCSKECFYDSLRKKSHTATEKKWADLDNTNRCWQCGKPMPIDRYSAYCEECEMQIVYTVSETDLTDDSQK